MNPNKKLLSRLAFLAIVGVTILGVFLMAQSLSKSQENKSGIVAEDGFIPSEPGKAILVEFSDFQCPACGLYYPLVKQLKADLEDKLVVVYKNFPLKQIHKNAELAARASEAALVQGKFWEMHNVLFEKQNEWSNSDQVLSLFTTYAVSIGLDKEKFLIDIDLSAIYDKINTDYQQGVRLGVAGTPTFFLNGKKITNPQDYDQFKSIIEQAIK